MSINEINAEAKESLRKYFKDSNDVKHGNEGREELTKEEIFQSVAGEIKTSEMKLEQRCNYVRICSTDGTLSCDK